MTTTKLGNATTVGTAAPLCAEDAGTRLVAAGIAADVTSRFCVCFDSGRSFELGVPNSAPGVASGRVSGSCEGFATTGVGFGSGLGFGFGGFGKSGIIGVMGCGIFGGFGMNGSPGARRTREERLMLSQPRCQ
jgi:hypothetical protein